MARKLSIVIISLNEEKNIGRLLESIKKQRTSIPYEIILADNNSKDRTREIARRYGVKIVKGGSCAEGRNSGARHAKGDTILFLDADTVLPNDFLEKNLNEFENKKFSTATVIAKPLNKSKLHLQMCNLANAWIVMMDDIYPHMYGFCIFVKKTFHSKIGGFNEKIRHLGEDLNYAKRAGKQGKVGILRSVPVLTSMRRFEKEGTIKCILRVITYTILGVIVGDEKANIFSYERDYDRKILGARERILYFAKKEAKNLRKLLRENAGYYLSTIIKKR